MVRLSKALYLTSPIVSIVAFIVVKIGLLFVARSDFAGSAAYLILGILGSLYSEILALVLFYKMWESIQDGHARTSPGKAIGFLFIPFFNFYWIFQVLWGFAKDYNAYLVRHAVSAKKLPEGLFLACVILPLLVCATVPLTTWIPFLYIFTAIAYWIVFTVVVAQVCDAVNTLPRLANAAGAELDRARVGQLPNPQHAHRLSLYCVSGEFANETLVIPTEGVSIGRDPARVNLVLASSAVSGFHARVLPEGRSAQVWLEDMHSLNGTFYHPRGGGGQAESDWIQLQGKILLSPGARFRLAVDGPEFEIRGS